MRRLILAAASASALAGALAVGPFGAAAAAPYVYGCTPATFDASPAVWQDLSIYNGSAATANLTLKVLSGDGTTLNGGGSLPLALTATVATRHTATYVWHANGGTPGMSNDNVPSSIRIVSDVPISATLSITAKAFSALDWKVIYCSPQLP